MKIVTLLITASIFLLSCKNHEVSNEIIIEGFVKNMPDGKIYLAEAHNWEIPLDSTVCVNGHFKFEIKPDSSFVPYMAAIHFPDSTKRSKVGSLFFRNHMLKADSLKYSGEAFYLEKGYTRIEGDNKSKPNLRVFAGKETDIMYSNQFTDFGWIGKIDSSKRLARILFFKTQIKKYPFSYFLLQNIYNAKEQYTKIEMQEILQLFNDDAQQSMLGGQIRTYLTNRPDPNKPYPNLFLLNSTNQRHNIIDTNSKLTMLVFWASWCGPCRMEIPMLKKVYSQFKKKGLNLVSISIDDNKENWNRALSQEKMEWPQYIVEKENIDIVKQQFNFAAIPFVVFTGNSGKEIMKFTGYDKNQTYESIIKKFIQ